MTQRADSAAMTMMLRILAAAAPVHETVVVDASAKARPFPHFWEAMVGSGRAALALRESYRQDLRQLVQATAVRYVRFHAIFHDELGVYGEDRRGSPRYNLQYVDQIYDGLLASGVRPFVEIGFMPLRLAARPDFHPFWYRPVVSPPKSYAAWDRLIAAFARHLIARYGLDEVSSWYFEVWNEPNFDFWTGRPAQRSYFELYDHTARTLKSVSPRLRVGGPATAATAWVGAMIAHAARQRVPLDFVSTHVYGSEDPARVLGRPQAVPPYGVVCPAVRKVHDAIKASARPDLPFVLSEFNVTTDPKSPLLDSVFMGAWLADTIRRCDGLVDMMSFWTFSDVFEEGGVLRQPLRGGFGLIGMDGIPKPSFEAMRLLHRLGSQRLENGADNVLVTRRDDGGLAIAAWNLVPPGGVGVPVVLEIRLAGLARDAKARVSRVDEAHGDVLRLYEQMGRPTYPSRAQVDALRAAAQPSTPKTVEIRDGALTLTLPVDGLALIEIGDR
jgi:xylan 1,4-beta-xylosidase